MPVSLTHSPKGDKTLWANLPPFAAIAHIRGDKLIHIACLEAGTESGAHSVMIRIPTGNPSEGDPSQGGGIEPIALLEITAREFLAAADAVRIWIQKDEEQARRTKAKDN